MKKTFSISKAISFGWDTFKNNWKFWVVVFFIYIAGSMMGGGLNLGKNFSSGINKSVDTDNIDYRSTRRIVSSGGYFYGYGGRKAIASKNPVLKNFLPKGVSKNVLGVASSAESSAKGYLAAESVSMFPYKYGQSSLVVIILVLVSLIIVAVFTTMLSLVSIIFNMGYVSLTLDAVRGKQVYYKTLLSQVSFKKAVKLILSQMLVSLIVGFGLILLVIPGICFALKYSMVPYLIIDKDLSIGDALKESSEVTKGVRSKILLMYIASGLLFLLGIIVLGIGAIPAFIVVSLAQAYVYNVLLGQSTPKSKPEVSPVIPPSPENLLA